MKINEIKSPAYVLEEEKLLKNLELLREIGEKSGAKVLCALKGFAFSGAMKEVGDYLWGATCSGLWEAKYAKEKIGKGEIHTYSPAFKDDEIAEVLELSHHIVFNSFNQLNKFREQALAAKVEIGLRVNPEYSSAPNALYNPCGQFSRLGITKANFQADNLAGVSGLHFHALCEESAESLEKVLQAFEEKFGEFLPQMKWLNFGGGHHITKKGYNVELLLSLLKYYKEKYQVQIYIEPGEAVGWESGYLLSEVLDIVDNGKKIAILDVSAEAHMPDTLAMPYRPAIRGEVEDGKYSYRFGGATCLAGDIIAGLTDKPDYFFDKELKIGDKVIFEDQIHYTIVKNTTFNGIKLPKLVKIKKNGEVELIREFSYEDFSRRN